MNDTTRQMKEFFIPHTMSRQIIMVREGETGYYPRPQYSQVEADELNEMAGHTPADLKAAEAGSMFGWDCPAAELESRGYRGWYSYECINCGEKNYPDNHCCID